MGERFISYAFQHLPRKKIIKYAAQYDGVDMAQLMGADEENFPCLIRSSATDHVVMFWNIYNGFMGHLDEDPVRKYATEKYLSGHAYPVFASFEEAEKWAREHDWPRKPRPGETGPSKPTGNSE